MLVFPFKVDGNTADIGCDDEGVHTHFRGKLSAGKIFVYDVEQVIRIRTGETGKEAL